MNTQVQSHGRQKEAGIEYSLYFALVFTISLPTAFFRMIVPRRNQAPKFFVTEAWSMAQAVTPTIFRA